MKKLLFFGLILALLSCGSFFRKVEKIDRYQVGHSIEIDGRIRKYIVKTPNNYNSKKKYPLLLVFHGARGNPIDMQKITGFNKLADREDLIVVYPFGTTADEKQGFFWNAWECCGYALQHEVDDIRFVKKLISILKEDYSIESGRVYATGFSNGGMLSLRLACEASEEFAAIASVGGAMFHENCIPSVPISIFLIQGKKDRVVPIEGGVGKNSSTVSPKLPSFQTFQFWSKKNHCERQRSTETSNLITYETLDCKTKNTVKMVIVKDEEHSWPEKNYPTSEEIWKFLNKWTKYNKYPT